MKKSIILMIISIIFGTSFTFFILNKDIVGAKEEYLVYAFQVGAYENIDNAKSHSNKLPSSIILHENNLYKVYTAMYKDIDIINEMVVYFEDNYINIYLKNISVDKEFYNMLDNYEKLIKKSNNKEIYNKINQSILNSYLESNDYDKYN